MQVPPGNALPAVLGLTVDMKLIRPCIQPACRGNAVDNTSMRDGHPVRQPHAQPAKRDEDELYQGETETEKKTRDDALLALNIEKLEMIPNWAQASLGLSAI
ncbi:MAG: hypothetical protein FRX49_06129 [Trebouxia sp. A1-2]|nr:MAG: hypothetical protein FRX49_06129 [Trebouxia sp. A1-2]